MDLDRHDFELDELMERIRANDNRLIALQVPEGLKMQALEMMDTICLLYTSPSPRDDR